MGELSLNLIVFGAGAIGTYVGGSMAHVGHHVVFLERPDVVEFIRLHGLIIQQAERGTEPITIPPTILGLAASLPEALSQGPFDLAIYALKSFDTPVFISSLPLSKLPPMLCLSNGVDNEHALEDSLGAGQVIAGTVTTAVGRRTAGNVIIERSRGIGIATGHLLVPRLATAMNAAGLNTKLYTNAADMKWSKMLTNLLANATSAILDLTPDQIFAHPGLFQLEVEQLCETLEVMHACGINIVNLPKTPVKALAFAVKYLPLAMSRPILKKAVGSGRGRKMPSFHIDLVSGRGQSEVGYLNGAVVRYGERAGIATPVNRLLTDTLNSLTRGEIPLQAFAQQPEKLIGTWHKER